MNKYKVVYYVVVAALLVSVFLLIGIDLAGLVPIKVTNLFGLTLHSSQ